VRLAAAALAIAVLATGAACTRKPAGWKEWIDEAAAHFKEGRYAQAFESCSKAFDDARANKDGTRAVAALECLAESSAREGKPEKAFPAFEVVLREFDDDLRRSGAGLRLRNNYGVALVEAGRKQEGVDLLEASLDAYEGTPYRSKDNKRIRMLLVSNLARAVRVFPDSDASIRVSTTVLAEIVNHLENERFRNNLPFTLGTADAMYAIAELIRLRGDPKHAEELKGQAKEQRDIEDALLEGKMRRPQCEPITVRTLVLRACYSAVN